MRLATFVLFALLVAVAPAAANVGARSQGGARTGEPAGIAGIAIAHEQLVLDARPLTEEYGLTAVSATYELDNAGEVQHLELVFATGSRGADYKISLDGHAIPSQSASGVQLPSTWLPPTTTPDIGGGVIPYEARDDAAPMKFDLDVPGGHHQLVVTYQAECTTYHHDQPTVLRQVAYVLSPAKTWAGFGGLDVTVHVPAGWSVAITPELQRVGDDLHGTFRAVPADSLAITMQAPYGMYDLVETIAGLLFAMVAAFGAAGVGWFAYRAAARMPEVKSGSIKRGGALGLAVMTVGLVAVAAPGWFLPSGQVDHRGYAHAAAVVMVFVASLLAVLVGAIISAAAMRAGRAVAKAARPAST